MRINRLELIEKIRAMVAEREVSAAERLFKAYDKVAQDESTYVAEYGADWSKFADRIRLRVRKEQAITEADIPEGLRSLGGWTEIKIFKPGTVRESDFVPRTEPLTRLIAVLESSPDEFISTSALDRIGAPLKELMRP